MTIENAPRLPSQLLNAHSAWCRDLPLAVVERDAGAVDKQATVERHCKVLDVNVATLRVRGEHARRVTLCCESELLHVKLVGRSVGR